MPGLLKDLYEARNIAAELNRSVLEGEEQQSLKILEVFEKTNGEIFQDREAFNSLSIGAVSLLAGLDRHFVLEEVLVDAVLHWVRKKVGSRRDCRTFLEASGFMKTLRWGLLDGEVMTRRYGFLFTPEEQNLIRRWRVDPSVELPFLNTCDESRGLFNAQEENLIFLTKPPLEILQMFRNDTSKDMKLQFSKIKLCHREYEFTREAGVRPETVYIEATSSSGDSTFGYIRTKPCHPTLFEVTSDIHAVALAGDTITIRIVLTTVGTFVMADEAECFGFKMSSATPGIIKELHASDVIHNMK